MMNKKNTSRSFTPFLKMVADDLIRRYGKDLSRLVMVFPNRRARLFLNEYLSAHGTVWAPQCITISEFFSSLSDLTINDPIDSVCRIHDAYRRLTDSDETLDSFYGWGERLLSDFDDTDKNMADAKKLFTNVKDYRSIDFGDCFTEEERKVIEGFFGKIGDDRSSKIRDNFLLLWNHMFPIYKDLNESLAKEGLAYEGALYRRTVEMMERGEVILPGETDRWVFVGFNVLDAVEHKMMCLLNEMDRALFYWDYDVLYVSDESPYEAGEFLSNNLRDFPNALPAEAFRVMGNGQDLEYVAAPTENAQAFSATEWVKDNLTDDPKRTAIVICNENLLEPVIHALPPEVNEVNVTKGFPLSHTTAYTKLIKWLDETDKIASVMADCEYISMLQTNVKEYATESDAQMGNENSLPYNAMLRELNAEACFRIYTILERLKSISRMEYFKVSCHTLRKLIIQLARQTDIPFHGEPAAGLQVMGVLETRNLDFENILVLSANEGMIPRNVSDNSFIPYPLKKAFGLTLATKKNAVYAYYFFRMIQRAKKVRLVYNCTADARQTGEMSRYMTQLLLSGKFQISHFMLSSKPDSKLPRRLIIPKPANILERLNFRRGDTERRECIPLSPSSLNLYLNCPLQFYFHRIAGLKKPQDRERGMDDIDFGNLFHDAAEIYYKNALEREVEDFKTWNVNKLREKDDITLRGCIDEAYKNLRRPRDVVAEETVLGYLKKLLKADAELGDLHIIDLETDKYLDIPVKVGADTREIRIGGRIDRIDVATNPDESDPAKARTLRIVDYKTGKRVHEAKTVEDIFYKTQDRPYYLFQIILYALTMEKEVKRICGKDIPISTVLFYPSQYGKKDYSPWIKFAGKPLNAITEDIRNEFYDLLVKTLEEIANTEIPFIATDNEKACEHCDFRILCGKR